MVTKKSGNSALAFLTFVNLSMKALQIMDFKCTIGLLFHDVSFSPVWLKKTQGITKHQCGAQQRKKLNFQNRWNFLCN